jgi:hypothetical protein
MKFVNVEQKWPQIGVDRTDKKTREEESKEFEGATPSAPFPVGS